MKRLNIGVKVLLVALLILAVVFEDWERFAGKGYRYRLVLFSLPTLVVPLVWRFRGRPKQYPHLVDALIAAPFLFDTLGNWFNFYNRYDITDNVLHFVNWIALVAGLTLAVRRTRLPRLAAFALGVGFGATAILWWEAAEYAIMQSGSTGLHLTYGDTIGDLVRSFLGGVVGAAVVTTTSPRQTASSA